MYYIFYLQDNFISLPDEGESLQFEMSGGGLWGVFCGCFLLVLFFWGVHFFGFVLLFVVLGFFIFPGRGNICVLLLCFKHLNGFKYIFFFFPRRIHVTGSYFCIFIVLNNERVGNSPGLFPPAVVSDDGVSKCPIDRTFQTVSSVALILQTFNGAKPSFHHLSPG